MMILFMSHKQGGGQGGGQGTYSWGVDAQLSGQDEEGPPQNVDVHLWRRAGSH